MNRFIRLFPFFLFSASFVIAQTQVRLNQLGYLPDGPKFFEIPVQSGVADSFYVLDPSGTVVLKGALGPSALRKFLIC